MKNDESCAILLWCGSMKYDEAYKPDRHDKVRGWKK